MKLKTLIGTLLGLSLSQAAMAQSWNLVFGMSQPLILNGGNIELNYMTDKWVFEYSHGFNLDLNASPGQKALTDLERSQGLKIKAPYSTGGGVGYRITPALNLRLEFKQHQFDVTHSQGQRISYVSRDLGVGAYYFYKPFDKINFLVVPSIRYWPTINTSLKNDRFTFNNGDAHEAHNFGLFGNVSMGWNF